MINNSKLAFGYKVFVDTGASDPKRGSFKIKVVSDDGTKTLLNSNQLDELSKLSEDEICIKTKRDKNELLKELGFVFNSENNENHSTLLLQKYKQIAQNLSKVGPIEGFKNSDDYIDGLANNIEQSLGIISDKINDIGEKLSGILVNAPAYIKGNVAAIIPNIKDQNNQSLEKVNFNKIPEKLSEKGLNLSDNCRFISTNDIAGAAAGVAQILASDLKYKGILKEGSHLSIWMTGGGAGIADIKVKNGVVEIETSESGHQVALGSEENMTIEKYGASAPALIKNYAISLNLPEETTDLLVSLGKAKLVSTKQISVKIDSKAEEQLKETGCFKLLNTNASEGKATYILDRTDSDHEKAKEFAIDKYVDALAQVMQQKIFNHTNTMILTGPMAVNLRKQVALGKFDAMVSDKIDKLLDSTGKNLLKENDFKFIVLDLPDNTVGGAVLLKDSTTFISPESRGNWINIPDTKLKSV